MKNLRDKVKKAIKKFVQGYANMMNVYGNDILKGYSNGIA
jgi:hypothetical protein